MSLERARENSRDKMFIHIVLLLQVLIWRHRSYIIVLIVVALFNPHGNIKQQMHLLSYHIFFDFMNIL